MATMLIGPLHARLTGQASRRGLIPRVPAADSLLADAETWLMATFPEAVRSIQRPVREQGEAELTVELHPAAPPLVMTASDTGRVAVTAATETVGPGYHRFVGRLLERMGTDLALTWERGGDERRDPLTDATATTFADRPVAERGYLAWLGRSLMDARARRSALDRPIALGLPGDVRFHVEGAILTALGPRDAAWLDVAVTDTRIATDVTPWWADATDGQYLLNRALCLMWTEVRWRTPALKDERLLLDEIHRLLSKAYPNDPTLAYPWRAWAELVDHASIEDPMATQVRNRAATTDGDERPIGYRRAPVTIRHEGWALEIPGSFAEHRTAEEWWGGGAGRNITLAAVQTGTATGAMAAQSFIQQFAGELGPDAIDHRAGGVIGRATLSTDTSSGLEVGVLEGYSAVVGSGAAVRIVFDDPADWDWAVDMWRSLAPG
ncbi:MAG TPA: hypothetical protein VIL81_03475 [Candidatus Limnocylindrales bacterium]|jgi:hypothetical protein